MDGSILASPSAEAVTPHRAARQFSPWLEAWRRFRRHRLAFASAFVLISALLVIALCAYTWKVAINESDFTAPMETPSWAHPSGTAEIGHEQLARMLYG